MEHWNKRNPGRVRAAQRAYYERERARRKALSPYRRAKEDVARILAPLTRREREQVLRMATKDLR